MVKKYNRPQVIAEGRYTEWNGLQLRWKVGVFMAGTGAIVLGLVMELSGLI